MPWWGWIIIIIGVILIIPLKVKLNKMFTNYLKKKREEKTIDE